MAKIKVTAGEGRTVPIDRSIATAPGAAQLYLKPGDELDVEASHPAIQRQLRSGDLVEIKSAAVVKQTELEAGGPAAKFEPLPEVKAGQGHVARTATPKKES